MTDQKRDESWDIGFFREQHVTVPWCCVHPEAVSFERFVPHSDLVAAEEQIRKLEFAIVDAMDQVLRQPADAICALRNALK